MKKIALTGGGSAGHVTLQQNLIPYFKSSEMDIIYIGSKDGIEKKIICEDIDIPYYGISTGKFRRYFTPKNILDLKNVVVGFFEARKILKKEHINFVFSKGGFVSVPVVLAASSLKIPIIIHESDRTLGLANRVGYRFCKKIYSTFDLNLEKNVKVGAILDSTSNKSFNNNELLKKNKPTILLIGGSQGAQIFNEFVVKYVTELQQDFNIILVSGKKQLEKKELGLIIYSFVSKEELESIYKVSDIVITRGGSNTLFELLNFEKKMIIVPLDRDSSRGDQIDNALYFKERNYAEIIWQEDFEYTSVYSEVKKILRQEKKFTFENSKVEFMSIEKFYKCLKQDIVNTL